MGYIVGDVIIISTNVLFKGGHHVSRVPGVAFVFFLIAGYLSPNKWLMLTALLDFSLTYLPVFLLKEHLKKGKSERENDEIKR